MPKTLHHSLVPLFLTLSLVCLLPARASAWGGPGHRIVARIAMWRLKQMNAMNALAQIKKIYSAKPDEKTDPRDIVTAASWPDSPAVRDNPSFKFADDLHFVSIPRDEDAYDASRQCRKSSKVKEGVCIIGGLEHYRNILLTSQDNDEQRDALSFIVHFIGDLHQPLHTSEDLTFDNGSGKGDIGGNLRTVCYLKEATCTSADVNSCLKDPDACSIIPAPGAKRKRRELHKVWDNFMFETEMDAHHLNVDEIGYAAHLIETRAEKLTPAEIAAIEQGSPQTWAEQSHALARSVAYNLPAPLRKRNPADDKLNAPLRPHFFISREYRDSNVVRAEEQLIRSGIRLALYLRQIFPDQP